MNALTPEAALRVSAEHLSKMHGASDMVLILIAEADRLEAAAKTPGQVLAESLRWSWLNLSYERRAKWEQRAAAVVAHYVGPDRVVVDRGDVSGAATNLDRCGYYTSASLLREALS